MSAVYDVVRCPLCRVIISASHGGGPSTREQGFWRAQGYEYGRHDAADGPLDMGECKCLKALERKRKKAISANGVKSHHNAVEVDIPRSLNQAINNAWRISIELHKLIQPSASDYDMVLLVEEVERLRRQLGMDMPAETHIYVKDGLQ